MSKDPAAPSGCPAPELSNMLVLDSVGQDQADIVLLADDLHVCFVTLNRQWDGVVRPVFLADTIDDLAAKLPQTVFVDVGSADKPDNFTVLLGAVGQVTMRGDTFQIYGPLHQSMVDLGSGRLATFVQFRFAVPAQGAQIGSDLALCTASGGCHPVAPE
ncbi:hypothetical protein ACIRST_32200 [Kitasatospora sp. NPDC101447]|uniref:hypothetical protein n=1 Tax=Kitasatospora sp. NPDC101447 TaxID=3364102 RepID=UPI00380A4360